MRRILIIFSAALSVLVALTFGAVATGRAFNRPDWAALLDCKPPCFAGVNPDQDSTHARAWAALRGQPELTVLEMTGLSRGLEITYNANRFDFHVTIEAGLDMAIYQILPNTTVRLGDLIAALGTPDFMLVSVVQEYLGGRTPGVEYVIALRWSRLRLEGVVRSRELFLKPELSIRQINIGRLQQNLRGDCRFVGLSRRAIVRGCGETVFWP